MKIALIIPIYKQAENWDKLLSGIQAQTLVPDVIYVMLDRASDEDIRIVTTLSLASNLNDKIRIVTDIKSPVYIGNPNKDKSAPLFLAGHIRNIAVENALKDECDIFVFIDGDCIPQAGLIECHVKKLNNNLPVLTIGRRREKDIQWRDQRENSNELMHLNLFRESGIIINRKDLFEKSLIVWSCNIALNLNAIKLLKKFNKVYYCGREEVFCSEFLGSWGGEDGFLGIQSLYCRIFVTTVGEKNAGVQHIDHPRPSDTYNIEHMKFFIDHCEKLKRKVTITPLTMNFFTG